MVQRTPGPFQYFQEIHGNGGVNGDTIRADADNPGLNAKTIHALGGELDKDASKIPAQLGGDITADVQKNPKTVADSAKSLAAKGYYAVGLIKDFARMVDRLDTTVNTLNTEAAQQVRAREQSPKYDDSQAMTSKIKASVKSGLSGRYHAAVTKLDGDADSIASRFKAGPGKINEYVRQLIRAGLIPLDAASLYKGLKLTGADKYAYWRSEIKNGDMKSFSAMTEAERQAFNKQHPDLVKYLMSLKHPDKQVVNDVVSLVLPHDVDPDQGSIDGDSAAYIAQHNGSPALFLADFATAQKLNGALAILGPWLAKNNLNASGNPLVTNAHTYLRGFVKATWPEHEAITKYINADKHDWRQSYNVPDGTHYYDVHDPGFKDKDGLLNALGDSILNTSNERLGGSENDLPSDVQKALHDAAGEDISGQSWHDNDDFKDLARVLSHSTAMPGTQMGVDLAQTVTLSNLAMDNVPGVGIAGDHEHWDDGLSASMYGLVGRNHESVMNLFRTDHDYTGGKPGDYPTLLKPSAYAQEIFGHPWSGEQQDQIKGMISWMHGSHQAGGYEQQLSDRTFTGVVNAITTTEGDDNTFATLMGTHDNGRDGDSSAAYNRTLTMALVDATSDHFGQLAAEDGTSGDSLDVSKPDAVRLMTYLASDHGDPDNPSDTSSAATRLSTLVAAYEHDRVADWVHDPHGSGPRQLADTNGRLSAMLDSGLINEASERGLNAGEADAERVRNLKIASGIVATIAGKIPVVGDVIGTPAGAGNILVANLLTADHLPPPAAVVDPDWRPDGSHVTTANTTYLIDAMVEQHKIRPGDLPEALRHPEGQSNAAISDAADQALTKYFTDHPLKDASGNVIADSSFYDDYNNQMNQTYKGYNDFYGLEHKDPDQVNDFLTDEDWGKP